jgi:hypothetical protein
MLEQSQIRHILAELLESPEFKESQRYRDLLTYLVEESLAGRTPKETTLGIQFFGKDASFNSKEDATVRVYLNNLRKKLEHYYLTTGKNAPLKLVIPVGHYKVEFVPSEGQASHATGRQNTRRVLWWVLASAGVVCAFLLGYVVHAPTPAVHTNPTVPNAIWNDFVRPDGRPTLVVLGDYFFLREQNPVSSYYRTVPINSPEDFLERVARNPGFGKKYQPLEFTFLRPSAVWGLTQILPVLQESPLGFSFKLASEFTTADFKSHNIVFIGTLKTLYSFRKFLHMFGLSRTSEPYESVSVRGGEGDSVQTFAVGTQRSSDYVKDFSIIAKGAGPEGSTILMMLGFTENGAIAAPRVACDSTVLRAVHLKYPQLTIAEPQNFTLVVATEGISQAVFKTDIRCFVQNKPLYNISDIHSTDSSAAH